MSDAPITAQARRDDARRRGRASRAAGAQRAGTLAPGGAVVTVLDVALGGALVCAVLVAGLWRYLTGAL